MQTTADSITSSLAVISAAAVDMAFDSAGNLFSIGSGFRANGTFFSNDPTGRVRVTAPSGSFTYLPGGGVAYTAPTSIAVANYLNMVTVYLAATALPSGLPSLFTISVLSQTVTTIATLPEPARWMDATSDGTTVYMVGVNGTRLYRVSLPMASPSATPTPAATRPASTPCPQGYFCPPTAPGSIGGGGGGGSVVTPAPLPVPPGMFSPPDSVYPSVCAPGYYCTERSTNIFGSPGGGVCPPGTYCMAGSSRPTPCGPGTFSGETGRSEPCEPCPAGMYSAETGATSIETCVPCDSGRTTADDGATSRDECILLPYACPAGTQPLRLPANGEEDCGPLSCDLGLVLSPEGTACQGCPPGFTGLTGTCQPCNATEGELCPGLISFPLPDGDLLMASLLALRSGGKVDPEVLRVNYTAAAADGTDEGTDGTESARRLHSGRASSSSRASAAFVNGSLRMQAADTSLDHAAAVAAAAAEPITAGRRLVDSTSVAQGCSEVAAAGARFLDAAFSGKKPSGMLALLSTSGSEDDSGDSSFNLTKSLAVMSPTVIIGIVAVVLGVLLLIFGYLGVRQTLPPRKAVVLPPKGTTGTSTGTDASGVKTIVVGGGRSADDYDGAAVSTSLVAVPAEKTITVGGGAGAGDEEGSEYSSSYDSSSEEEDDSSDDDSEDDLTVEEGEEVASPEGSPGQTTTLLAATAAGKKGAVAVKGAASSSSAASTDPGAKAAAEAAAAAARAKRRCCGCRLDRCLTAMDQFKLNHKVKPGRGPVSIPSPIGGCFSLMAIFTILVIWAFLIAQRQSDPYVITTAVSPAGAPQRATAAAASAGTAVGGMTGVHVVVSAVGEMGACANISWAATPLHSGKFVLASSATCGAAAQHVFSCSDCVFQAASQLRLTLHYSCQGLVLEGYGVSHSGEVSTINVTVAPDVAPAASADATYVAAGLLSTVTWELPPLLLVLTDTTAKGSPKTRGELLTPVLR